MKLSHTAIKPIVISGLVLTVSLTTGLIAGNILHPKGLFASASSANITVENNNQVISQDQSGSTKTITKTSTVTVKNTEATHGYTLTAQLAENTIQNSTVHIYSTSSTTCSSPGDCPLNTSTPTTILTTDNDNATTTNGDTTTWTIQISVPANTPLGNYIVDIAYEESTNTPPGPTDPGTTHGAMQSLTNANCPTLDTANPKAYTTFDARNNQIYYVAKIDGLCWMLSNLKYEGDGSYESSWGWDDDRYATTASNSTATTNDNARPLTMVSAPQASTHTDAQIADPGGDTDYTNTTANGGFYGYLYNWCAAMGGQADACNNTSTSGFDTIISICPAGWRLPVGNGGEFQTLNNAVNSGSTTSDAGLRTIFLAVYSGFYYSGLSDQGGYGYFWSSTVYNTARAYDLYYYSPYIYPSNYANKSLGFAVRCVK